MTFDVRGHGRRYEPEYPPNGFSDHLPMVWLAMERLGLPGERRERYAQRRLRELAALDPAGVQRRRVDRFGESIARRGRDAVLQEALPELITGWTRAAYHPLIRIGYGVEFGVDEEVAAGLAYLKAAGPNPRLGALAAQVPVDPAATGRGLFQAFSGKASKGTEDTAFNQRVEKLLAGPLLSDGVCVLEDNLRRMSRAALDAFAATHNFFALHLVTGSHAFRLVRSHAGPHADAILNLGLLAGYLAIGAPEFPAYAPEAPAYAPEAPAYAPEFSAYQPDRSRPIPQVAALAALCRDDEHDLKLCWTALAQAGHWDDPAFLFAAEDYLSRKPSRNA